MIITTAGASVALPAAAQSYSASATYQNPDGSARGPCIDPWISRALEIVDGRADPAYCAVGLYNGGHWNSFNQLVHAVAATRNSLNGSGTAFRVVPVQGASYNVIAIFQGGNLVAAGGGNLVAAGGGNLVAAGGGNLIIRNNQLVTQGGGNIAPIASIGSGYSLQSAKRRISLPVGGIGIQ